MMILKIYIKDLTNQEISLHCRRHRVFTNYKDNYENIKLGVEDLKKINTKPNGFAGPFGEWNDELNKSLEALDFNYSSEFSYTYDCFPFYPVTNNSFSKILQIPIHPLSFGRLRWGGHTDEAMLKYFINIIEQKLMLQEPIILYTHPSEERLNILNEIFKKINSFKYSYFNIWKFS